jgi:general secretion pathway protein K
MNAYPRRQRGVALLVALLVVALATILIAALLDRGELAFARTRNALRSEQADAYALGLEIYAAQVLFKVQTEQRGPDTSQSPWAQPLPPQPVPGGLLTATMRDLNGCFNLNNLSAASTERARWLQVFTLLLKNLALDPNLAAAVQAWLSQGQSGDVSPNYYLALAVPYRPRSDVFAHVSELRLVAGVSSEVYARLAPYVCALPPGTTINLNTASAPVLQSVDASISAAQAQALWNNGQARFQDLNDFETTTHLVQGALRSTMFEVNSAYFLARGDVVLDDVPFTFYSLIERGQRGIRVLSRSRGSDDTLTVAAPIAPSSKDDTALD